MPPRPYRDDLCPARSFGLPHVLDPDDHICVFCEVQCSVEPPKDPRKVVSYTPAEVKRVEFWRWLRETGRI